ncbi:MAG: tetratricopeptide repeat protein [Spirochaetia bacterium]
MLARVISQIPYSARRKAGEVKGVQVRQGEGAHDSAQIFEAACQALREGMFSEAIDALESLLEGDVDFTGASSAMKCAGFWRERGEKEGARLEGFERGEQLLGNWRLFQAFVERLGDTPERCLFSIKQFVFSSALASFSAAAPEPDAGGDPYLLLQIGRCFKGVGNYESAIECLERANQETRDDARILAELADCYSLVNESRAAKVFFREAYYVDPQAVDLPGLESPLVQRLAAKLRGRGFMEPLLNEWMPVYGAIWGVFSVKREMKPLELGKLKQAIYQLEKECRKPGPGRERAVPRLINRYLWLIDHYMTTGEPRERIEEVLAKLRETDPGVHEEYAK